MRPPQPRQRKKLSVTRVRVLAALLVALLAALEWRLIHLQVLRHPELEEKAEAYEHTVRTDQSWRGEIQDCRGRPLAMTVPAKDIYADLTLWTNRVGQLAGVVAPLLGTEAASLAQHVDQDLKAPRSQSPPGAPRVLLLKRGVARGQWASIQQALAQETFGLPAAKPAGRSGAWLKNLRRWTLFAVDDQQRFYPYGELLAPTLGFVGTATDGHLLAGRWGLEASLNKLLAGGNGWCDSSQDAAGNELAFCRTAEIPAVDGAQVVLTIDLTLQQVVEQALAKAMTQYHPSNASCVIIRPATGEILALASLPAFSPQQPGGCAPAGWRNHVISDEYEVGSVFKVITLATALDRGAVNLGQRVFCENGHWTYQHTTLRDDDHHYGDLTVGDCLAKSSNIGFAKIGLLVGADALYNSILRFGFGSQTGVPLCYETPGFIRPVTNWTPASITRIAIGHELAVSQLQLAMAYAAIANDGELMRPLLVKAVNHADGSPWGRYEPQVIRRVVRPETARLVRAAMRGVVEHGTGQLAALPGYSVAGKTGTAQKSDGHRYLAGHYYCSFVGMVPANKPELVIAVAVDDPGHNAYGGTVAAPIFREIASKAVAFYGIAPDPVPVPARPAIARRPDRALELFAAAR